MGEEFKVGPDLIPRALARLAVGVLAAAGVAEVLRRADHAAP